MRLVDFYIDPILKINEIKDNSDNLSENWQAIKSEFNQLLINSQSEAIKAGFSQVIANEAMFPVVAYIDELILTSKWRERVLWQKKSLQRIFFNTTNSGFEFYERLNKLNRQGDDRSVREVYLLCLSLGYKGRFYSPQDRPKIEEARGFNLDLLLPNDANKVFEKSTLFNDAYHEKDQINISRKTRINLIPLFAITPIVVVAATLIIYSIQIGSELGNILGLVK
jgi:type VI secretion system protein ImpK